MTQALFAAHALLPTGWAEDVLLRWDAAGRLSHVQSGIAAPTGVKRAAGPMIPGMPNLHSHAFQRGIAGLTEFRGDGQKATGLLGVEVPPLGAALPQAARGGILDSFWSWRTLMYRFALKLAPAQLEAIAFGLYVEMLEAGYTSVCEFHYVHHEVDGRPYADDAELALAVLRAAKRAGIGLTLLPVLYQNSGFGGKPPNEGQRRFIRSTDSMLRLLERLQPLCAAQGARLGLAPHSLRAVTPDALREALAGLDAIDATTPIHIHIAEQTQEVDDCVAWSGQRPVAWLLNHAPVDGRWCLVHATHMNSDEYRRAAASGAVAGLCPSTEANLGDGFFDLPAWCAAGGVWGLGSDSHVCVNAAEELMLLEYSQRLTTRQRSVTADAAQPHVATAMTLAAVRGGARAAGRPIAGLAVGQQADFVVLNARHASLAGLDAAQMLAGHVFASHRTSAVQSVYVGGQSVVLDGQHAERRLATDEFVAARRQLLQ